ncbi:hypothetical protein PT974_04383 [Cladobotryum mycophilum]|uniref:Protein kinase domain-containing protein n=1 Tax=Cladobotryum mycophilum TaxID=491253 RepID=A0ABR0SUY9_9HYPO
MYTIPPDIVCFGSSSLFRQTEPGVLLKFPHPNINAYRSRPGFVEEKNGPFSVERRVLEFLGSHSRIVPYLRWHDKPGDEKGLLVAEASEGSLQKYMNEQNDALTPPSLGVIHADLRPENFLVHATSPTSLDIWLCDFGGALCKKLGVDGGQLPDSGFFDPRSEWIVNEQTDIFSVGSLLYTILTGHWPYREPPCGLFSSFDASREYDKKCDELFKRGEFPDVSGLFAGNVILKCWEHEYENAGEILQAMQLEVEKVTDLALS